MRAVVAQQAFGAHRLERNDAGRCRDAWRQRRQGRTANGNGAQLADALVGVGEMVDLVERERRLSEQQDGASQGDGPARGGSILSRRL
ncbi:hypothetical protein [Thiocystis violacea]|uniref:hypothetical protein n=1 Tax=Thiocystis violacea TaxID=13725 RepID=UPI0019067AA7|nr:hypothetical protein [Thiocystis violacea]